MGIKLTLILLVVIFVAMRLGGGAIPERQARQDPVPDESTASTDAPTQMTESDPADALPPVQPLSPRDTPQPGTLGAATEGNTSSIDDAVASALSDATSPEADAEAPLVPGLTLNGLRLADDGATALSLADTVRQRRDTATADVDPLARPTLQTQTEVITLPAQDANPSPETAALLNAPAPEPAANALPRAQIIGSAVNLRAGPSTAEPVVGKVNLGQSVEVIGEAAPGWTIIRHPVRGDTVYISTRFLDQTGN